MNCKMCKNKGCVLEGLERELDHKCLCYEGKTNYDRIVSKSPEELAEWIIDDLIEPGYYTHEQGFKIWLDWLKQEAKE